MTLTLNYRDEAGNAPWNKRVDSPQKGMASLVVPKVIGGGVLKLERVQAICPACGEQVEAVATDGRVRGYCAVARQYVDFPIETELERKKWRQDPEYRAKLSAAQKKLWQDPEYRAKISADLKKLWQDPEYRAKLSAAQKKRWQDPEYRARQIATHTGKHHTAEHRAKISEAIKRRQNKKAGHEG